METEVRMCSDCRWCGNGWFLLSPQHRKCYNPSVIKQAKKRSPSGYDTAFVGVERRFGAACAPEGKFWNEVV